MNVLIVHAHENEESFCSALKNKAREYYKSNGSEVEVSDLYKMNFNPVAGKHDFKKLSGEPYYKTQKEQLHAYQNNLFADDIKQEMDKFERADIVIFNFPMWWYSLPAILKGWVDRVFAMGFSYGGGKGYFEDGAFPNKKALLTFTTGGPKDSDEPDGEDSQMNKIIYPITFGMLYFVGLQVLPPFIAYGPPRATQKERETMLSDYESYLKNLDSLKPIY
ncbi:MAG: NAD(P)H-dependent oxidoreductase [bacterium]|nr:NAD(P)H-dependent oxidoreductase [bacterium]